jgi:hypothetical protein
MLKKFILKSALMMTFCLPLFAQDKLNPKERDKPMKDTPSEQVSLSGLVSVVTEGDKQSTPLANAVVYFDATESLKSNDLDPVVVVLKDGRLSPEQIVVTVGQKLIINVEDKTPYSLRFASPKESDTGRVLPKDVSKWEKVFEEAANSVQITCDINAKFKGFITVVPNRAFAISSKDGSYMLTAGIPQGKYDVVVYHPKHGRSTVKFDLKQGANIDKHLIIHSKTR